MHFSIPQPLKYFSPWYRCLQPRLATGLDLSFQQSHNMSSPLTRTNQGWWLYIPKVRANSIFLQIFGKLGQFSRVIKAFSLQKWTSQSLPLTAKELPVRLCLHLKDLATIWSSSIHKFTEWPQLLPYIVNLGHPSPSGRPLRGLNLNNCFSFLQIFVVTLRHTSIPPLLESRPLVWIIVPCLFITLFIMCHFFPVLALSCIYQKKEVIQKSIDKIVTFTNTIFDLAEKTPCIQ